MKVMVDTNTLPLETIAAELASLNAEVCAASVTEREVARTSFAPEVGGLPKASETFVLDESPLSTSAVLGEAGDASVLEQLLHAISNGTFPKRRDNVSPGSRRQLRDAMILDAARRSGVDLFVSDDIKAIGTPESAKRQELERLTATRIMTSAELRDAVRLNTLQVLRRPGGAGTGRLDEMGLG